eukprot:4934150-Amphidinium_carterae.1
MFKFGSRVRGGGSDGRADDRAASCLGDGVDAVRQTITELVSGADCSPNRNYYLIYSKYKF